MSTDVSPDAGLADKDLKKKLKVEEQTNKLRKKALEEAKQRAAARGKAAADDGPDDDGEETAEMSEEQRSLLAKLKETTKLGRLPDSLPPLADGMQRRLTQLETDLARRLCEGKDDDELKATYARFADDRSEAIEALAKLRREQVEAWRAKTYKGKTGADLEARAAKLEGKARKLYKTVQKQFIVLSKAAAATVQNLEQAEDFVKIGMFDLDKGDDANKDTFLHSAARDGEAEVAAWLLNHGASATVTNDQGDTPLHLCVAAVAAGDKPGAWATLWHLVERGADLEAKNLAGKSAADVAAEQAPPVELWAVANLLALAHGALDTQAVHCHVPYVLPGKNEKPVAELTAPLPKAEVQRLGLKDWKAKQILRANELREEEAARKAVEEEAARKADEEAEENRKELVKLKKASKILQRNLEELWPGLKREATARQVVELLCAPPHLRTIREKLIDVSSPPAAEAAGAKRTPLHLAVLHFKPMVVEALLASEADVAAVDGSRNTALHLAAQQLADAAEGKGLAAAAPDVAPAAADDDTAAAAEDAAAEPEDAEDKHVVAFKLTEQSAKDMVSKLLEAGAARDAQNADGKTATDLLPTQELKDWLAGVTVNVSLFDEGRKNRILAGLLMLLEATRSGEEQARVAEAQARIEAKKRAVEKRKQRALEEAKRKQEEEMTAALLAAAGAERKLAEMENERLAAEVARKEKEEKLEAELARVRAEEEERRKREEEEQARADALMAEKLAQGKQSREQKLVDDALRRQQRLDAEAQEEAARAEEEMRRRLEQRGRGRKPDANETPEERRKREKIEAEEAAEEGELPKMYDEAFNSIFTSLDLTSAHPTKEQVAAIAVHLTEFTKRQMFALSQALKYFRKGVIGLAVTAYDQLQLYETLWEQCKSLDELIDASIGETKTYRKAMTQAGFYSARVMREANRRIQVLHVNQCIYEDLMNKIVSEADAKKKVMGEAKAAGDLGRFNKFWAKLPDMAKNRAAAEESEIDDLFNPVLAEAGSGALLSTLLELVRDPLREMEVAMEKLGEDARDELPLDLNITDRLESSATREWDALGYAKRQMHFTDGLVRDLRGQKTELEKQLASEALPAASRKEFEEMLAEITGQLHPLDTQHDMYEAIIRAVNEHQKEAFVAMTPNEQLLFERKRVKEEAKLEEYYRKQAEEAQRALDEKGKRPNKTDALIGKVLRDHADDWDDKKPGLPKSLLVDEKDELIDDLAGVDLDANWMTNRFGDLSGIDHDIIEDLKLLTEQQAAHYLAIKMAENEADASFARLMQVKAQLAALSAPEQLRLADYSAFLDRRYPMYERLYHVLESGPRGEAKFLQLVDLDLERDHTKDLYLAKRIQEAKIDMLDWRDVREQCAADTFCASMAKLGGLERPSLAVSSEGGVVDNEIELSEDVLSALHRNLHAQCCVSQDVVYMIINTVAGGKVTRKNLVRSLHALHVACHRDDSVYWDSQVMFPAFGGFGSYTRDQSELIFGFNDHDVGTAYYEKFIKALQMATEKAERADQAACIVAFPDNLFSRRALGLGSSGAEFFGAGEAKEDAMTPGVSVMPVDRLQLSTGKDLFISAEELVGSKKKDAVIDEDGNVLKPGAERAARLRIGYWDLRHHLVAEPDISMYNPTGWSY
jgi:hypothetical protein